MTTMTCQQELVGHTDIVLSLDSCVTTSGVPLLASSAKDHTVQSFLLPFLQETSEIFTACLCWMVLQFRVNLVMNLTSCLQL